MYHVLAGVVAPVMCDLNAELLSLVTLLPVVEPSLAWWVVMVVLLSVAVQARPGRHWRRLAAVTLVVAEISRADTDGGVIVTSPVVAVLESLVTAWPAVLDVEVVVPATPELVTLFVIVHPDTQSLVITADLLIVKAGHRLILLDPIVTLVTPLGCGGREGHWGGPGGVIQAVVEPVVAVVSVITKTSRGILVAGPLDAVLTYNAAVLAVHPVVPGGIPTSFHLERQLCVIGVQRKTERQVILLTVNLLEVGD